MPRGRPFGSEAYDSGADTRRGCAFFQQTTFSGPLPHPDILKQFDEVVPGSGENYGVFLRTNSEPSNGPRIEDDHFGHSPISGAV